MEQDTSPRGFLELEHTEESEPEAGTDLEHTHDTGNNKENAGSFIQLDSEDTLAHDRGGDTGDTSAAASEPENTEVDGESSASHSLSLLEISERESTVHPAGAADGHEHDHAEAEAEALSTSSSSAPSASALELEVRSASGVNEK